MWNLLRTRWEQGQRTSAFPAAPPDLPERFQGRPVLDATKCPDGCRACEEACPTEAVRAVNGLTMDLGRCLFCQECVRVCPAGAIRYTPDPRLAASRRDALVVGGATGQDVEARLASALNAEMRRLFGRSLKLRQVSAGGCTGCEAELVATGNVVFDLGRFGIQFVASPRHADGLVLTGPVTENMREALRLAWEATPSPRIVVSVGACAISGGPFRGNPEVHDGADGIVPVDLYIPGCPPHPFTILEGLLRLLGRLEGQGRAAPRREVEAR
ncbi:MAG: NADH-quinone oxidoreductase subunit NuoB [Planctomycetes bacterium]|nr:NADH-quinone oxidoreductase subunit NuoB [Planctomycetota bacterium]